MDQAVQDAVSEQIGKEFYAAYLYLATSAHFDRMSLLGFSRWMRLQAQEELSHAMRLFDFMNSSGTVVQLGPIDEPPSEFGKPLPVFEAALAHEREVSDLIHRLYDLAVQKHDHATQLELQWFITEQMEEEKLVNTVVEQIRMAGENQAAILMLDRELGTRTTEG